MSTVIAEKSVETSQLTAADRCDVCGARAYMKAELQNGALYFCAHHGRKHKEALAKTATYIVDETALLS